MQSALLAQATEQEGVALLPPLIPLQSQVLLPTLAAVPAAQFPTIGPQTPLTAQGWLLQDWDKAAPLQVASPPQEAPVQVLVCVPPPQERLQELQPLNVPLTGLLVWEQEAFPLPGLLQTSVVQALASLQSALSPHFTPQLAVVPLQEPTQSQVFLPTFAGVPALQTPTLPPQAPLTGLLL